MARTEAMKEAQKRYRARKGNEARTGKMFGTELPVRDFEKVEKVVIDSGMSKADFIRWAVAEYEKQKIKGELK